MSEKRRILDMIESGKITAAEGMDLIDAIDVTEPIEVLPKIMNNKFKYLKVLVEVEEEDIHVNVNIPLNLIKVLGGMLKDINKVIPENAKDQMLQKGININEIDFDQIISALNDGTLEDTTIVDISMNDKEDGIIKVKIYVD